jgi:hypothetical protein
MEHLTIKCKYYPREYTYVGIGSANRTSDITAFNEDMDQILPLFLDDIFEPIRVIHFDPEFKKNTEFLKLYFYEKGFIPSPREYNTWIRDDMEVIIMDIPFVEDDGFMIDLIATTVDYMYKLVVQRFTGAELIPYFQTILDRYYPNNMEVLKYVLFDMTYGTNCNCMTPMTRYRPIVDHKGNFYNLAFYSDESLLSLSGIDPMIDNLLLVRTKNNFSKTLNNHHVNYRKKSRGEEFMFPTCNMYNDASSLDEIMSALLEKLKVYMRIFRQLGYLTPEKEAIFTTCSNNYKDEDLYRWYCEMAKIYK